VVNYRAVDVAPKDERRLGKRGQSKIHYAADRERERGGHRLIDAVNFAGVVKKWLSSKAVETPVSIEAQNIILEDKKIPLRYSGE